VLFTPDDPVME